jgi:catechol 2,3-dioxygenase-like lactoylglutathione lyase family enzyme
VFDLVTIAVSDVPASERFYTTVLSTLGVEVASAGEPVWADFALAPASDEQPLTQRLHVGFAAPSRAHVDDFWRAGVDAGYRDDGEPGLRPQYGPTYYGGFLLDPDGNSAEAVHHDGTRSDAGIDHLWIRVADVAAARRFYTAIAPHVGLRLGTDRPERVQLRGQGGSFSLVAGTPTEHLRLSLGAAGAPEVDAFHRAAVGAGHADAGAPGERTGGYRARVLDPDGNVVEAVARGRAA